MGPSQRVWALPTRRRCFLGRGAVLRCLIPANRARGRRWQHRAAAPAALPAGCEHEWRRADGEVDEVRSHASVHGRLHLFGLPLLLQVLHQSRPQTLAPKIPSIPPLPPPRAPSSMLTAADSSSPVSHVSIPCTHISSCIRLPV